jgi:23S rRNA G2445 N2-methylase RlmL
MQYYAFAVPGLEEIAGQELAELGADVGERRRGVVFFSWDGDPQGLLALTTVEDVYALVARDTVKRSREGLEEIEALVADAQLFELAVSAICARKRARRWSGR